ncbi:MAG: hypothetical protein ACOZF0_17185 [Thermodesulfobacteriota bacterium]
MKVHTSAIAKRLIWKVMMAALVLIVMLTSIIGIITYYNEKQKLELRFDEIRRNYLDIIRTALWVGDKETIEVVLLGICRLPGIDYADIHSKDDVICKAGNKTSDGKMERRFAIVHTYNGKPFRLGELHVAGSQDYVRRKIIAAVLAVGSTQAATILMVCVLILLLMYRIVIRRLLKVTTFAAALSFDSLATPFPEDKNNRYPDELDGLVNAVNRMRENLFQAFARQKEVEEQLLRHRQDLETIVEQRTSSLKEANEQLTTEMNGRKKMEQERENLIGELQRALGEVKKLSGMLPICSHCKKIRDDKGYWSQVESYIQKHSEAEFSHSICPDCARQFYPDLKIYDE